MTSYSAIQSSASSSTLSCGATIGRQEKLYEAIAGFERVLACGEVSKYWSASWVAANQVFAGKVVVFALRDDCHFALLNSFVHIEWAEKTSSRLKDDPSYSLAKTFETLPFPYSLPFPSGIYHTTYSQSVTERLNNIGRLYHELRSSIMIAKREGLTDTYNRFHNPDEASEDIAELRRLHVAMDQAVAAAYGWGDLDLGHGFHQTKQGLRYTISEAARRTVLDRLLALNHQRYAEETAAGLHDKGAKKAAGKGGKGRPKKVAGQEELF